MAAAPGNETLVDASAFEQVLERHAPARWVGWRRRLLIGAALLGCLCLLVLARSLARTPQLDAQWAVGPKHRMVLAASDDPALREHLGAALARVIGSRETLEIVDARLFAAPRWTVDDQARARHVQARAALQRIVAQGSVLLEFTDGSRVPVPVQPRGLSGIGLLFWLLAASALLLVLLGAVIVLAKPQLRNLLFAIIALCQACSLLWIALDSEGLRGPLPWWGLDHFPSRLALDLAIAAGSVHAFALHPTRLPQRRWIGAAAWGVAAIVWLLAWRDTLPGMWWWGQGTCFLLGVGAVAVLSASHRREPNPFASVMRRLALASLLTFGVATAAVAAAELQPGLPQLVGSIAVLVWYLFFSSLLVLVPFLSRGRALLREFALLAGVSTVATSLDLVFISIFALEPFASLTLAVFVALAVYAGARQWMLGQALGRALPTTERTFEQLYRVAREVQQHPERHAALLTDLLRELFDPLDVTRIARATPQAQVAADGSLLVVPVSSAPGATAGPLSLALRYAQRGRRIFTQEDARLTDRVVEQLARAVAYDRAVEHGRSEERARIAQDLHDDIGARLLTLMYKASDPEVEDYLRQTLKDLKTLTRGFAAAEHRLLDAAAEWKSDIQQRLTAAQIELEWVFNVDKDVELGVVQWAALTRVLRELVSNVIHHGDATRLHVWANFERGVLTLSVADDGSGRAPEHWSHGLGLGGIRKRVKQLGGHVRWRENAGRGICCEVRIPRLGSTSG